MILRLALVMFALSSGFTSILFAGSERAGRIVAETGGVPGVQGVAGVAGIVGPVGAAGGQGVPGSIVGFSDFFALQGGAFNDNPGGVAAGAPVLFPRTGSNNGVITRVGTTSTFLLPTTAAYLVMFQVSVNEAAQLELALNGVGVPSTVVGRVTGTNQIVGLALVVATAGDTLSVINHGTTGITVTPLAGGTNPASAHLVIFEL